jgi:hypothetical protein
MTCLHKPSRCKVLLHLTSFSLCFARFWILADVVARLALWRFNFEILCRRHVQYAMIIMLVFSLTACTKPSPKTLNLNDKVRFARWRVLLWNRDLLPSQPSRRRSFLLTKIHILADAFTFRICSVYKSPVFEVACSIRWSLAV